MFRCTTHEPGSVKMVARNHLVVFSLIFVILEINLRYTVAKNCTITKGDKQYVITDWTWEYRGKDVSYKLNLCSRLNCEHPPRKSAVCRTKGGEHKVLGLADNKNVTLAADNAGFSLTYTGPEDGCGKSASAAWHTTVVMKCGKFLGSPILVEESVDDKGCWAVFEFVTNEACKIPPKEVEIPCSIYLIDGQRDLTPLIKLQDVNETLDWLRGSLYATERDGLRLGQRQEKCENTALGYLWENNII